MSVLFALLSALANASSAVLQRVANLSSPGGLSGRGLVRHLLRQPLWLLGSTLLGGTFVFLAIALYFGSLALVQPLVVTELIFALAVRRLWLHDQITTRSWVAAALTCGGLAGFLVIARPSEGSIVPSAAGWAVALGSRALVVVVLLGLAWRGRSAPGIAPERARVGRVAAWRESPTTRAALIGCAAGLVWSVDAGFVKSATVLLRDAGWLALLVHWPLYALAATGVLGTLLVQTALHVGPLSASQPALLISDPLASIVLGVELFGERLSNSAPAVVGQVAALALMAVGVVLLSRWAPPPIATGRRAATMTAP